MKEAFWGVLIITLGLFGIVVVNLFQNITVDNDRTYYVIKEATEGAVYDAIDLGYYRLNSKIRIVEEKFVENLTRRFAENISKGKYKIVVEDVNEMPPKVSLRVETGVGVLNTGLLGKEDPFNIVNRVDAIIESKYDKEELEDITTTDTLLEGEVCPQITSDEDDMCINGDMMYMGDEDITIQNKICTGTTPPNNVSKKVNYKVCECGKWVNKQETITANPRPVTGGYEYKWVFYKEGKNRVINEVIEERILELQCTDGIQIMVPKDIHEKNQNSLGVNGEKISLPYQPSSDNSNYELCPSEGIKIPLGMSFVAHPNYIPANSVNRNLIWETSDASILGVGSNSKIPTKYCQLNSKNSNCFSVATITANKLGTAYIKVETTDINKDKEGNPIRRGQTATCKVEVYDGSPEKLECKDLQVYIDESKVIEYNYELKNATKVDFEFSVLDTSIATVNSDGSVTGKSGGTTTLTIKEKSSGKTGTCTINVPTPPDITTPDEGNTQSYLYQVKDKYGNITYYNSYDIAIQKALNIAEKTDGSVEVTKPGTNEEYNVSTKDASGKQVVEGKHGSEYTWDITEAVCNGVTCDLERYICNNGNTPCTGGANDNKKQTNEWSIVDLNNPALVGGSNEIQKPGSSVSGSGSTTTGRPNGNGGCLDGNTKILTLDGYKNISEIKVGDMVLSYNSETKENEYKEVTTFYKHINMKDVLYTMIVNNKTIKATRLHRFYVKTNNGYDYVKVEDLKTGDLLMDSKGNYHSIRKITSKFMISNYYDIEVKGNHNYYIGRDNILVHNALKLTK